MVAGLLFKSALLKGSKVMGGLKLCSNDDKIGK